MIDGITSSTKFPPEEPPRKSVMDRIRTVYEAVRVGTATDPRRLTLSRRNFDEWWREVDGRSGFMGGPHGAFRGMDLKCVLEQGDDACIVEDGKGVLHVLPF